jgi:hypothetical protein
MAIYEIPFFTWVGAVLLAVCGLPQAIRAHTHPESTRGLSWFFLGSWALGELAMFAGLMPIASAHVLANYGINFLLICYICGVKYVTGDE